MLIGQRANRWKRKKLKQKMFIFYMFLPLCVSKAFLHYLKVI